MMPAMLNMSIVLLAIGLFVGMVICAEIGYRIGTRRARRNPEGARAGTAVTEGAIFALLGLMLAFSFSGAAARLDARRQLVVQEANAIGTAYLRLDLLPASEQPALRRLFRQYLDTRLLAYEKIPDIPAVERELAAAGKLQNEIWFHAQAACRKETSDATPMLVLPALNEMIDITTTRTVAGRTHMPVVIAALLFTLALLSAVLVGHAMSGTSKRNLLYLCAYAATVAITVYVILDLEYPRVGLIRVDQADQVLRDLRDTIR